MPNNMFFTSETNLTVYAPPVNPQVFVYDANGNVTDDGLQTYTWDDENRLTAVETSTNVVGAARRRSEFVYDHQWRRLRRQDLTDWSAGTYHTTNSTRFVYDGWNVVQEIVDTPTLPYSVTNYFAWGQDLSGTLQGAGGIGGLLCRVSSSGAHPVLLYCYDGNGNVQNLADASGNVVATYTYDPFGRTVKMTGPAAVDNVYRFSTKPHETAFAIYYYGYRFYAPSVGRWLTKDPIGEEGFRSVAISLAMKGSMASLLMKRYEGDYLFVGGNPISRIDLFGLVLILDCTDNEACLAANVAAEATCASTGEQACIDAANAKTPPTAASILSTQNCTQLLSCIAAARLNCWRDRVWADAWCPPCRLRWSLY